VDRLRVPADGVPDWVEHPAVRMVTIAPELPGALALIERLAGRRITVSLGHSGATAQVARTAIDAGARMVTHVFNAMGPLHHRAPGLAGVALVDERVRVGVIPDARHVDPIVLELVRRCAGDRVALVAGSPVACSRSMQPFVAGSPRPRPRSPRRCLPRPSRLRRERRRTSWFSTIAGPCSA
jgi:hypothetical protein